MKKNTSFAPAIFCFALFLAFTLVVRFVGVAAIGPEGSSVGLAALNGAVAGLLGENLVWYEITDALGKLALLTAALFGAFGLYQWIARKSLAKVDGGIWALCGLYVLVLAAYAFFEKVIVNYRPVILEEGLEASYPSSHTMLALCVFASAKIALDHYLAKKKGLRLAADVLCIALIVVTVGGRLISGVHWLTDIIGAVLLSAALLELFAAVFYRLEKE